MATITVQHRQLFPFALGGGEAGSSISIIRLPFGWKYSPALRQRVPQFFIKDLKVGQAVILHYLDDFMDLGKDRAKVAEFTAALVATLTTFFFAFRAPYLC